MTTEFLPFWGSYNQLDIRHDKQQKSLWYTLKPKNRPCFDLEMLAELRQFQQRVVRFHKDAKSTTSEPPVRYLVLGSSVPGVFNLGGDLHFFNQLIRAGDRAGLFNYAKACIDVLYPNAVNFQLPITTISLVQGDALGGGFEAAISSNVVIAEKSSRFGLPEVLFNLVPGMGAYSFLLRRTNPEIAERIIMSGEQLSAEEMYSLNLIDKLVDDGEGEAAVKNFIVEHQKQNNAHLAMSRIRQCVNPITYEELIRITKIWVDAALQLKSRDLRMIEHLVRAQNRRCSCTTSARVVQQEVQQEVQQVVQQKDLQESSQENLPNLKKREAQG